MINVRRIVLMALPVVFLLLPLGKAEGKDLLKFTSTVIDVGTISEDDNPVTYSFPFTNVGRESVILTKVYTTCGCTAAEYPKDPILPGGKGEIRLTYNPNEHPGELYTRAFVYSSHSANEPIVELVLTGNVTLSKKQWKDFRYQAGDLRMRRKTIRVTGFGEQGCAIERLYCVNTGTKPLKLTAIASMIPGYAAFFVEPSVIQPGMTAFIVVKIDRALLPKGKGKAWGFPLILEGLDCPPSERTIKVVVDPAF